MEKTIVLTVALLIAAPAAAEELVPTAREHHRSGFAIGLALGPSALLGLGVEDANATGGSFSFRVGTSAGPRLLWFAEFDVAGYLFEDMAEQVATNQYVTASVALQGYVSRTAWLKGLLGVANFRQEIRSGVKLPEPEENLGINLGTSFGIDVYRKRSFALDLEISAYGGVIRDGALLGGRLALGAHFY